MELAQFPPTVESGLVRSQLVQCATVGFVWCGIWTRKLVCDFLQRIVEGLSAESKRAEVVPLMGPITYGGASRPRYAVFKNHRKKRRTTLALVAIDHRKNETCLSGL